MTPRTHLVVVVSLVETVWDVDPGDPKPKPGDPKPKLFLGADML